MRSDRKSGVKVGDESANKYKDSRAMVSLMCQLGEAAQDVRSSYPHGQRPERRGRYTQVQNRLPQAASCFHAGPGIFSLMIPKIGPPRTLFGSQTSLLWVY